MYQSNYYSSDYYKSNYYLTFSDAEIDITVSISGSSLVSSTISSIKYIDVKVSNVGVVNVLPTRVYEPDIITDIDYTAYLNNSINYTLDLNGNTLTTDYEFYDTIENQEGFMNTYIRIGNSYKFNITVKNEIGDLVDLSDIDQVVYRMAKSYSAPTYLIEKDITSPEVTIVDAPNGLISVELLSSETKLLPYGSAIHEVYITNTSNEAFTILSEQIELTDQIIKEYP